MTGRLLIAGAGIGGLALARALHSSGWSVEIAERAAEFKPLGVAIVIHPNGMRALARLGLAEQVAAAGNVVRHMEIRRAGAARRLGLPEVWAGVEWPTISILRPELHRILIDGALRSGGARLAMARGVAAMERTAAPPRVRFIDGTADDYDLVVGADGVHSAVRGSIDAAAAAVSTGLFYLRFATRNVAGLADDVWWTTERADGSYGFIPLGAGRAHCFVQVRSPTDELIAAAEQDEFIARFDPAEPALSDALAARVGSIYRHLAYMVRPVAWGRGACALLGDAAHAVSPTLSEGGSLAIEDALVLARFLREHHPVERALELYRAARQEPIAWAHRMSLAQVAAARRGRATAWTIDREAAVAHMREMYEPLRRDPLLALSLPDERV